MGVWTRRRTMDEARRETSAEWLVLSFRWISTRQRASRILHDAFLLWPSAAGSRPWQPRWTSAPARSGLAAAQHSPGTCSSRISAHTHTRAPTRQTREGRAIAAARGVAVTRRARSSLDFRFPFFQPGWASLGGCVLFVGSSAVLCFRAAYTV